MDTTANADQQGEIVCAVIMRRVNRTATIEIIAPPSVDEGQYEAVMYSFRLMAKHAVDTMIKLDEYS